MVGVFWYKVALCAAGVLFGPLINTTFTENPAQFWESINVMARVCQVTGKRPITGNNVSHAKNRTRRRFLPNLHQHRFWLQEEKRFVTLRVSSKGMRIIDKRGIEQVLEDIRARGEKV
jgi:large subunit ribosomal protein L28